MKVGKSRPYSFDEFSERFSTDSRIGMGIAKLAILGERRLRITTVPGVDVPAYNLGGVHQFVGSQLPRLNSSAK